MPLAKELKLNLPSADDLFSTQEERNDAKREKVSDIPLSEIDSFPDHPFLVKLDEAMQTMADSVKTFGIQTPAIVRQKEDGRYRMNAAELERYSNFTATIKTSYADKLNGLKKRQELSDCYDCIDYMIKNMVRLEQEAMLINS